MTAQNRQNKNIIRSLIEEVWNGGDADAVDRLVAESYTIHRDPRDPWDGKTVDRATFKERLAFTFHAFPDQRFDIEDMLADGDRVAVRWRYRGTHKGDIPGFPATGRAFDVFGMTIYELEDGKARGHWQALDRIDLMQQLGAPMMPSA